MIILIWVLKQDQKFLQICIVTRSVPEQVAKVNEIGKKSQDIFLFSRVFLGVRSCILAF